MSTEDLADIEYKLLCMAVKEAARHATEGDVSAGVRCLHDGMKRAEEFAEAGADWGWSLACSYRAALRDFTRICGVDPACGILIGGKLRPRQVVYTPN